MVYSFPEYTKRIGYVIASNCEDNNKWLAKWFIIKENHQAIFQHWSALMYQILNDESLFCRVDQSDPSDFLPLVIRNFQNIDPSLFRLIRSAITRPYPSAEVQRSFSCKCPMC